MPKYSCVCTIRSAAKLENGWDISGTILIKFLIKSNSVSFKGHFPYPRCIASFSSRIETKSFPSSFLQLFPLGQKKHTPSRQYHPTSSRFARKTDCLDGRRKLRDRSSGPLFAFSTQCQRHPRKNHPRGSSNYLPRSLLNHADCRPHATDKFSCHDTLSFVSTSCFPRTSQLSPFIVATLETPSF